MSIFRESIDQATAPKRVEEGIINRDGELSALMLYKALAELEEYFRVDLEDVARMQIGKMMKQLQALDKSRFR